MAILSDLFERLVNRLAAHRVINAGIIILYFLFIFYMHDPLAHFSVWVMNGMSLPVYNIVVMTISILLLILFIAFMSPQLIQHRDNRWLKICYLSGTILLIILHYRTMFEMNIEIIHLFQYSILALLIFPLTRRFGATVVFAIPFMLLDEWHQYAVLYPAYVDCFEFNDIIMDIYGCGLAMLVLLISGVQGAQPVAVLWRRPEFLFLSGMLILAFTAIHTGFISLYDADKCPNTWLVLNRIHEPITFWRQYPGRKDTIYHLMQPVEVILSISILSIFYFGLDSFRK